MNSKLELLMCAKPGVPSLLLWVVEAAVGLALLFSGCRRKEARIHEGRRLFEQARFQEAEQVLTPLFEEETPPADSTTLLYGRVLLSRGEVQRAREVYDRVRDRTSPVPDEALYGLARAHFYLGHPDTARALARRLLQRARSRRPPGPPLRVAEVYHVLGRTDFYEAHYDRALEHQRESLRWARRAGSRKARADALRQQGVLHWYQGRDSAKAAFYEPALHLYRQVGDSIGAATTLSNIGLIHWQKNQWRKNARYQLRAFAMRNRMGDQIGLADSYAFLAGVPGNFGLQNPGYQITYLRKSLELSRHIGYAWGQQVALRGLREALRKSLSYWESSLFRPEGVRGFRRSGEHRFTKQIQAAKVALRREEWARADRLLARAHRVADSLGYSHFQRSTLVRRSRVLVQRGRWDEAEAVLRDAQSMDEEGARSWTRDTATQVQARIALQRNDSTRAADLLRSLAASLDRRFLRALHETAPEVAFKTAVRTVHGRRAYTYGLLIEALMEHRGDEAFRVLERERALPFWGGAGGGGEGREALRQLGRLEGPSGQKEIQKLLTTLGQIRQEQLTKRRVLDRTGPAKKDLEVTSRAALQRALQQNEVFVEYFVRQGQCHVFVARRDSSRFLTVPISQNTFANSIDVYRSTLRRGREHPDEQLWQASSRRLFKTLLRPLFRQGWIDPGDRLLIAPHHRLWGVPFHALPLPSNGDETRFLIERNRVSYARSATELVEQRSRSPRLLRSALAVAPSPDALPHTKRELEHVRTAPFDRERVLVGKAAQKEVVQEAWADYDVVHLAAHARTNTQFPLYSPLELRDGHLELYEVLGHSDGSRNRLVVLSACETGRNVGATGKVPTGASVVGFPRAFLRAGAGSVVGSLWRVDDVATARLMRMFYRELTTSGLLSKQQVSSPHPNAASSLAGVLAQAQRTYLEEARQSNRPTHPFYWAAFALIGDGR